MAESASVSLRFLFRASTATGVMSDDHQNSFVDSIDTSPMLYQLPLVSFRRHVPKDVLGAMHTLTFISSNFRVNSYILLPLIPCITITALCPHSTRLLCEPYLL